MIAWDFPPAGPSGPDQEPDMGSTTPSLVFAVLAMIAGIAALYFNSIGDGAQELGCWIAAGILAAVAWGLR